MLEAVLLGLSIAASAAVGAAIAVVLVLRGLPRMLARMSENELRRFTAARIAA